jgi:NAD(P)H-flavin reductase
MSALAREDAFVPEIYRVTDRVREGADTVTLGLMPASSALPAAWRPAAFEPGQFNMLYAFGAGEIAISMSGDPADRTRFVHTVRSVGAVSAAISALEPGGLVGLRGPFGAGWPMDLARDRDVVIVAGGLGLAPLRPAIYQLLANRRQYRRAVLLVGMRTPAEILFRSELERWRGRLDVDLDVTVDRADESWRGNVGVVPTLIPRKSFDASSALAMICGPEIMMRFTANALRDAGVAPERIYVSMERNMKCAIGLCGHCQFGPTFVCKDGPVMRLDRIAQYFATREV